MADLNAQLEDEHEAHRDEMEASVKSYEETLARATVAEERAEAKEREVSVRLLQCGVQCRNPLQFVRRCKPTPSVSWRPR